MGQTTEVTLRDVFGEPYRFLGKLVYERDRLQVYLSADGRLILNDKEAEDHWSPDSLAALVQALHWYQADGYEEALRPLGLELPAR